MIALDVLLLFMISVCVIYCWILNQRIRDLHNSRAEFASMIKAFDMAVAKAEHCIADLTVLGKNSTAQVKRAADTASEVMEELKTVYAIGDKLGTKLELSIMEARKYQKSIEETDKISKKPRYQVEEGYGDEMIEESEHAYDDLPKATMPDRSRYSAENRETLSQNLLDKVLDKMTLHQQTIDQDTYYKSLRKVSLK